MTPPLQGVRLLVTRPQAQADVWCEHLQSLGADAVSVPMLVLEPVSEPEQVQAVKQHILDFDLYQKAIFVSRNAVAYGMDWLQDYWPQLPQGVEYFAVGDTTARALEAQGVKVSALKAAQNGDMNSESLLAAPDFDDLTDQRIVIFRGCGGRAHMGEVLRQRGARVDYCELYHRLLPDNAARNLADACGPRLPDLVTLHSGESLNHYRQALAQLSRQPETAALAGQLLAVPVLVPGERVAELARSTGFTRALVAQNATDASMLDTLLTLFPQPIP